MKNLQELIAAYRKEVEAPGRKPLTEYTLEIKKKYSCLSYTT